MKLVTRQLARVITEVNYTPEFEELYWYYSGTSAGYSPNNPYSRKRSSTRTVKIEIFNNEEDL